MLPFSLFLRSCSSDVCLCISLVVPSHNSLLMIPRSLMWVEECSKSRRLLLLFSEFYSYLSALLTEPVTQSRPCCLISDDYGLSEYRLYTFSQAQFLISHSSKAVSSIPSSIAYRFRFRRILMSRSGGQWL